MKLSSPAKTSQKRKLIERKSTPKRTVNVCGQEFVALQNVYDTSIDTELMVDVVEIRPDQTFVEIGCGTGAVSLLVGKRAKNGLGVDINPYAIKNANLNKERMNIHNVDFKLSDVFDNVDGNFDIAICNPPYSPYKPSDEIEMMFWDENNSMKKKFFDQVGYHLNPGGYVYFGYANFEDIDQKLPLNLAKKTGLTFVRKYSRKWGEEDRIFFVYKFRNPLSR